MLAILNLDDFCHLALVVILNFAPFFTFGSFSSRNNLDIIPAYVILHEQFFNNNLVTSRTRQTKKVLRRKNNISITSNRLNIVKS